MRKKGVQHLADKTAMTYQQDLFAAVFRKKVLHKGEPSCYYSFIAFHAQVHQFPAGAPAEKTFFFRSAFNESAAGFPDAAVFNDAFYVELLRNDSGSLPGAEQVAGVNKVPGFAAEPLSQFKGLRNAFLIQWDV